MIYDFHFQFSFYLVARCKSDFEERYESAYEIF